LDAAFFALILFRIGVFQQPLGPLRRFCVWVLLDDFLRPTNAELPLGAALISSLNEKPLPHVFRHST
jgi:hypothetical protein